MSSDPVQPSPSFWSFSGGRWREGRHKIFKTPSKNVGVVLRCLSQLFYFNNVTYFEKDPFIKNIPCVLIKQSLSIFQSTLAQQSNNVDWYLAIPSFCFSFWRRNIFLSVLVFTIPQEGIVNSQYELLHVHCIVALWWRHLFLDILLHNFLLLSKVTLCLIWQLLVSDWMALIPSNLITHLIPSHKGDVDEHFLRTLQDIIGLIIIILW